MLPLSTRDRVSLYFAAIVWGYLIGRALASLPQLVDELHQLHRTLAIQNAIASAAVAGIVAARPAPDPIVEPNERCPELIDFAEAKLRCVLAAGHEGQHRAHARLS